MIPYYMKRPSHKELYGKIREAKKAVAEDKVLIVEQEAVAADALDLEYLLRQSYWTFFRNSLRKRARVITLAQGRRKGHMNGRLKGWSFLHSVSRVIGSSAAFIINSPLLKSFFGSFPTSR